LGYSIRRAALALGIVATASATWAQPAGDEPPPSWFEGPSLTGDWGGVRSRLAEHGFTPYAIYNVEAFGMASGGSPDGADWTSELEFGLDVDMGVKWREIAPRRPHMPGVAGSSPASSTIPNRGVSQIPRLSFWGSVPN
jgi:hypothetical protein